MYYCFAQIEMLDQIKAQNYNIFSHCENRTSFLKKYKIFSNFSDRNVHKQN